jgi:hypothetical protein
LDSGVAPCVAPDAAPFAFESFDDGGWTTNWSSSGPPGLTAEAPFTSPLFALASQCMDAGCAGGGPTLARYVGVPSCLTKVRFEAELRIDSFDAETYEDVGLVALGPDGIDGKPHIRLNVGSDGNALVVSQLDPAAHVTGTAITVGIPPRDAFKKIAITIDYSVAPPTVRLDVDGIALGSMMTNPPLPAAQSSWLVRIGMLYTTSVYQPWTVRYDDVAFFGQ